MRVLSSGFTAPLRSSGVGSTGLDAWKWAQNLPASKRSFSPSCELRVPAAAVLGAECSVLIGQVFL